MASNRSVIASAFIGTDPVPLGIRIVRKRRYPEKESAERSDIYYSFQHH
jgi:hypothetical protein